MSAQTLHDFELRRIDGSLLPLRELAGQAVLVVNTASACGFTPQFTGLEALHRQYAAQGLAVLGVPCNQFGRQDPGSNEAILQFCQGQYDVSFPMMAKVEVNGGGAAPLFQWLKSQAPGVLGTRWIKWNFTKFLVGRDGRVIRRYGPRTPPAAIAGDIEAALAGR
jgi:glutathione peroxidase